MKKYIFVFFASLMATVAMAQMTPQEEREFYQKAYAVMTEYAQCAAANNESKAERFKLLFANTQMEIFNDLMSLDNREELSIDDYVKALRGASTVSVSIKNLRKGQVSDQGDTWQMPVFFEKKISYVNTCGTYIDSHEYFGQDYPLSATIVVDKDTGRCYIGMLRNNSDRPMTFPKNYTVLVKSDARDDKLTIDGRIVTFNPYDQVLLHPGYKIKYLGADVGEEPAEGENCDRKIVVNYFDKNFRVKLHGSFALGGFSSLGDKPNNLNPSSSDLNFGLDLGYIFPSTGKLAMGIFVGAGISSNKLDLNLNGNHEFTVFDQTDIDGDSYERHYLNVSGMSQTMKATDLTVPIYVDFEYRLGPVISAYADLGVKLQVNMSSSIDGTMDPMDVYGVYKGYGENLILDGRYQVGGTPLNGFSVMNEEGNPDAGFSIHSHVDGITAEDFNLGMGFAGLLGLGVRANFGKSLAVEAGIQYQLGFNNRWSNDNQIDTHGNGILIHYDMDNKQEQMENLLKTTSGLKQGGLRLHIGLIYKF